MTVYTSGYRTYWMPSGSWVDITTHIKSVSGDLQLTGDRSNALAFGDSSDISCELETQDLTLQNTAYDEVPVKIDFTINGNTQRGFTGIITSRERTLVNLRFNCEGYKRKVSRTRIYSPMFEGRPAATVTSAFSIENPANASYVGGIINYTLWQAGGRPKEQSATYPAAVFYYSVPEWAPLTIDFAWLAGEDAWEECLKAVRASGGQLLQDRDGTIVYRQPLSYGAGTVLASTFDEDVYGDLTERSASDLRATKVVCPVIPRTKQLTQVVIEDSTPRRLLGGIGQTLTVALEPQNPIAADGWLLVAPTAAVPRYQLPSDAIKAVLGDGSTAVVNTHYTYVLNAAAQQITLLFTNKTAFPITFTNLVMKGRPVVAGETTTVTVGSGTRTLTLPDNAYIQSQAHAERIALMTLAFNAASLPLITMRDCVYDPDRVVGESINITSAAWGLSAVKHLIVAHRHDDTGARAEYDVVNVNSLPNSGQFFTISPILHWAGQSKKLGY